jgi:hypothetical protein
MIDKQHLLRAFLARLERDLDVITRAALLARDEAIDEESRAESKWDTRGQEAAYLAEGQAKMAAELTEAINLFRELDVSPTLPPDPIRAGSVFVVKQPNGEMNALVAPRAGGTEVTLNGKTFTVVTPTSPIGREVLGKRAGDFITMTVRRKPQPFEILSTD